MIAGHYPAKRQKFPRSDKAGVRFVENRAGPLSIRLIFGAATQRGNHSTSAEPLTVVRAQASGTDAALLIADSICLATRVIGPLSPAAGFHRSTAGEQLDDNDEGEQQRRINHK